MLLSALGYYLGVYDSTYNPADKATALSRLKPVLKARRTLVISDNLESLLPAGEAPLDAAVRTQLWDVMLDLAKLGADMLLTSRDTAFGDGRLAPGSTVAHLPLAGLSPDDAYALAIRLLTDLGIDRQRARYAELRNLLRALDHHPLAICLVLSTLRQVPLSRITAEFTALLHRFEDDIATDRNRSLLASLEYSLHRLTAAHRTLLPRLAIFEGGTTENNLLAITQIPEREWAELRPALEQAALLTAEQVHEDFVVPFLHFHPVLAPYLRSQQEADESELRERFRQRYYELVYYLYYEDHRHPQSARALMQCELPNMRRALDLLLEAGELNTASEMTERISKFLTIFGLRRELDELRQRVEEAVAKKGETQTGGVLTWDEWIHESGRGEDEYKKGDLRAAYSRFNQLLARIKARPAGIPVGHGSYEHCLTLGRLARCLIAGGQPAAAEALLREALVLIETLLTQQPALEGYVRQRGAFLAELADALKDQGKYPEAQAVYEEVLKIDEQLGDVEYQALILQQLGTLARLQGSFDEAELRYASALAHVQALDEPSSEADIWHQLGIVAYEQNKWAEAERCYRASLELEERLGDTAGAAATCNQLALVAQGTGRPIEAESWYKRALDLNEPVDPDALGSAMVLSNLADLLVSEVRAGHAPASRLVEAREYAEQALTIKKPLEASTQIWATLSILAEIAEMEGRVDSARAYRRKEREAFAAFAGNRYYIDQRFRKLIEAIAVAAKGDRQAREAVEEVFPELEAQSWQITAATHRIWAGEREWHSLVEDLDGQEALLVLRVLEMLAQAAEKEVPDDQ